jgi:hypothetical protein
VFSVLTKKKKKKKKKKKSWQLAVGMTAGTHPEIPCSG